MHLKDAVQILRDAFKEYELLSEDEKKTMRTQLYQAQGSFGKMVTPLAAVFRDKEKEIAQQRHNDQLPS